MTSLVGAATTAVATHAEDKLRDLSQALQDGRITTSELAESAALIVESATGLATTAADVAFARRMSELTGSDVAPMGAVSEDRSTEVAARVKRAMAEGNVGDALSVLVRDETFKAGQQVYADGLSFHKVPGWRRAASAGSCEMCSNLAAADFLPSRIVMLAHKGCSCYPDPVLTDPQMAA